MKRLREKCMECGDNIPASNRVDSKFCSPSCKARYWRKKKEQQIGLGSINKTEPLKEIKKSPDIAVPLEGLRGVIDNPPKQEKKDAYQQPYYPGQDFVSGDGRVETKEYKEATAEKAKIEAWGKGILKQLAQCEESIKNEQENRRRILNTSSKRNNYRYSSRPNVDRDDLFWEEDLNQLLQDNSVENKHGMEECNNRILRWEATKKKLLVELNAPNRAMNVLMSRIKTIPQYEKAPMPKFNIASLLKGIETKKQQEQQNATLSETLGNNMKEIESSMEAGVKNPVDTNDRVISSNELLKIDYKCLDFQGRWKDFLGRPAVIFHTAVHGLPGGGKSTFCLQYSDYLAKNFGNVIYVCGEERFSKTLQEKLQRLGIKNPNLFFHDARNYDDIKQYVSPKKFHFIVIDSLDTLRIDAVRLKELKEYYPQSAFVTISQSRKDGKMKGDNEILHDADTVIGVHKGIAITSKNRFNASDRQFEVFK